MLRESFCRDPAIRHRDQSVYGAHGNRRRHENRSDALGSGYVMRKLPRLYTIYSSIFKGG
jgi:hypothetical protein